MLKEKKRLSMIFVVGIFAMVFLGFSFLFACFSFLFAGFSFLNISGAAVNEVEKAGIIAMVDPAIYKPDDTTLTIYGACRDSALHPLAGSTATISIYNSTQDKYVDNAAMTEMITGRFNYSTTAPSVNANYFIEINCSTDSAWALAYSNFQVADWAGDIDDIEGYLEDVDNGGLATINAAVVLLDGEAMRGTDNAMLAGSYVTERGTEGAETEVSAVSRYNDIYGKVDTEIAAIYSKVNNVYSSVIVFPSRNRDCSLVSSSATCSEWCAGFEWIGQYTQPEGVGVWKGCTHCIALGGAVSIGEVICGVPR